MSRADLDELVQEATVDAYGENEQLMGLHAMIGEDLALPFPAMLLGVEVTEQRVAALRDAHTRKPSLIARFAQAGLTS